MLTPPCPFLKFRWSFCSLWSIRLWFAASRGSEWSFSKAVTASRIQAFVNGLSRGRFALVFFARRSSSSFFVLGLSAVHFPVALRERTHVAELDTEIFLLLGTCPKPTSYAK